MVEQDGQLAGHDIFVSYAHADELIVGPLVQLLRVTQSAVFRDKEQLQPGDPWRLALSKSIANCKKLLVFWSKSSAESAAVRNEYRKAIKLKKTVIPVRIDATPITSELSQYHWIDLRAVVRTAAFRTSAQKGLWWGGGFIPPSGLDRFAELLRERNVPNQYADEEFAKLISGIQSPEDPGGAALDSAEDEDAEFYEHQRLRFPTKNEGA